MTLPIHTRPCADCGVPVQAKHARYCPDHRWRHRVKRGIHPQWTPARDALIRERYDVAVRGRAAELARLLHVPKWKLLRRAAELGLSKPVANRRPWTADEVQKLWAWAGSRTLTYMSRQLRRSMASVALKLKRERMSRRWREGYTMRDLEDCFGVGHRVLERWAERGWLSIRHRGTDSPHDAWYVTDADVLAFIMAHPTDFELRRVDQTWFMDLLLGGGVAARALVVAVADEEEAAA